MGIKRANCLKSSENTKNVEKSDHAQLQTSVHFVLPAMHQPLTFDGNVRVHGWGDRQEMTAMHIC